MNGGVEQVVEFAIGWIGTGEIVAGALTAALAVTAAFVYARTRGTTRQQLYEDIRRRCEWPLIAAALLFIPLIAGPSFIDALEGAQTLLTMASGVIWGLFLAELIVLTYLAPSRRAHLRAHWYEIPIVVVPFLRPLRIARSARLVRLLKASRVVAAAGRSADALRWILQKHGLQYILAGGLGLYLLAALLIMLLERDEGNITNYGEALWWGIATMTTLRTDHFPVTQEGRVVAVVVAILGLTLVSVITANVAAFLFRSQKRDDDQELHDKLDAVLARLEELEGRLLRERRPADAPSAPADADSAPKSKQLALPR